MRSKNVIKNIITNLLSQLITIIYGFVVPIIIINKFGSDVNGLISSITQFLAYISLLESGFGPVVSAALYGPISKRDNKTIVNILKTSEKFFRNIAYIFIVYIIILCCFYPLLVNYSFDWIYTISLIIIISISTFAEYFFGVTYRLFIQANQKTYIISLIRIITYILSIIAVVFLANIGVGIHVIKLVSGLVFVLRPVLQNYYVKRYYKINYNDSDNSYKLEQKWDGLAQHIAAVIHGNTDVTVLTIFTTLSEVSVYSVYYMVVFGLKSIFVSLSNGIEATFGDMIAKNESENLNKKFSMYEILYISFITIAFSTALVMIVPFVSIYTKGVTDVNYIRPLFGFLIVISEYIYMIRLPYISLAYVAGHFKETRIGAWVECISNLLISIILVWKFGLVGVTIGTIVAMTIRSVEFLYHSNKYILKRNVMESVSKIILLVIETSIIVVLSQFIPYLSNTNFFIWIINVIITLTLSCIITFIINYLFFKKDISGLFVILRGLMRGRFNKDGDRKIIKEI